MPRSLLTRLLHAGLALAVIHQLLITEWMVKPRPGREENWAFEFHETGGLVTLGLVSLFWLWTLVRRAETAPGALLPWLNATRRAAVFAELRQAFAALRRRQVPAAPAESALASAVHGLGLLAVLAVAASGTAWLLLEDGNPGLAEAAAETHEVLSNLVWAYLVGHAGLAVLHELAGHRVLRRMFPFGRR